MEIVPIGRVASMVRQTVPRRAEPLNVVIAAVAAALSLGTVAFVLVPGLRARVEAPSLDLVLDTITTVVTLTVAVLAWVRFRQGGQAVALFQTAAFLVLAIANSFEVALATAGLDARAGLALASPGQAPLYDFTMARVFAAALLVTGSMASLHGRRVDHSRTVVVVPAVAMLLMIGLVQLGADRLPSLGMPVLPRGGPGDAWMPTATLLGAAIQVLGAALFLWASGLSLQLHRRYGSIGDAYLAVGVIFAAFAQVQTAIYPGMYAGLVTSGDVLRLMFDVILLFGIQADAAAVLARFRRANDELARLGPIEVEHAALEERARLSRELHDGLAQDLWLAKLKTGRLAALPDLDPEARALTGELIEAIDAGIAEAHQAMVAIRLFDDPTEGLAGLLARYTDDFADRFGLRVELECEPDLPLLSPRAQAESLRIMHEALTNVRRHADATVVRLRVGVENGRLALMIGDNGRGFDAEAAGRGSFGLTSMRERAALIGGELRIESRRQDGTRVSLLLPLATPGVSAAAGSS